MGGRGGVHQFIEECSHNLLLDDERLN